MSGCRIHVFLLFLLIITSGISSALELPRYRWEHWTDPSRDLRSIGPSRGETAAGTRVALLPVQSFVLAARTSAGRDGQPPVWPEEDGIPLPGGPLAGLQGGVGLDLGRGFGASAEVLLTAQSGGPWRGRIQRLELSAEGRRYWAAVGRMPVRWGDGIQGGLLMGRSAPPLWSAQGSTARPLRLPGPLSSAGYWRGDAFLAYLDDPDRVFPDNPGRGIPNPLLMGQSLAWMPTDWFEAAAHRTALFGGEGRTGRLTPRGIWEILWGLNENLRGDRPPSDSDQRASFILRARIPWVEGLLPGLQGLDGFWEYGGEDFLNPPIPSAVGRNFGAGLRWYDWTARADLAETHTGVPNRWYDRHTVYGRSHFYRGYPLGLTMGADAQSLFTGLWSPQGRLQGRAWRVEQIHGIFSGNREMRVTWGVALMLRLDRGWVLEWELLRGRRIGRGHEPLAPGFIRDAAALRVTFG